MMVKINIPITNLHNKDLKSIILQSEEIETGKLTNHQRCFQIKGNDFIWCSTWNIYDNQKINKIYRFSAINTKTMKTVWKDSKLYIPRHHLFSCYKDHNIDNLKAVSTGEHSLNLKWTVNFYDDQFSPKHIITVDGKKNGKKILQKNCIDGQCVIELNNLNRCYTHEICVKTKFNLNDGKNIYKKRNMVKTCTRVESNEHVCNVLE